MRKMSHLFAETIIRFTNSLHIFLIIKCMGVLFTCIYMHMCMPSDRRDQETSPGIGVTDVSEPIHGFWKSNPVFWKEQPHGS